MYIPTELLSIIAIKANNPAVIYSLGHDYRPRLLADYLNHDPGGLAEYQATNGHYNDLFQHLDDLEDINDPVIIAGIDSDSIEVMESICQRREFPYLRPTTIAAKNGKLESLKYLIEQGYGTPPEAAFQAIINNHHNIIEYFVRHRIVDIPPFALYLAIKHGHQQMIDYLRVQLFEECIVDSKHQTKQEVMNSHGRRDMIEQAAASGYLEYIRAIKKQMPGVRFSKRVFQLAVSNGYFKIVRYLYEDDPQIITNIVDYAAKRGYYDIVKYLIDRVGRYGSRTGLRAAIRNGYLGIVRLYVIRIGVYVEHKYIIDAVASGRLDTVRFLWQRCKINDRMKQQAIEIARVCGYQLIVDWITEHS